MKNNRFKNFHKISEKFQVLARKVSDTVGSPVAFVVACMIVVVWATTGPLFGFSDTWQLVINTGTTIVTFLMVFLIQATQNRDAKAIHTKLDRLIKRDPYREDNELIAAEESTEEQIEQMRAENERK